MKKRIIVTAAITACLALCAAVWPQNEAVKEVPAPPAVNAPEAIVKELEAEVETAEHITSEAKPVPAEAPIVPDIQPTPESEVAAEQAAEPPATQTTVEPPSGDIVYVPGFGWIESEDPNHVEYAEGMYENGNKIGIMG